MNIKQIELKVTELKHRRPFVPFVFELEDGRMVEVPHAGLALDETGVGFIGADGGLTDVPFKDVRAIRFLIPEEVR